MSFAEVLRGLSPEMPVLIAGPTASGKSALALEIAQTQGGVIVNADASQVYDCWRVITARPDAGEEAATPHLLYGHIEARQHYSTGHWLREMTAVIGAGQRPIITGGTGLYFKALTEGLAEIPATPHELRQRADALDMQTLQSQLDAETAKAIDMANRARVQRAWEVVQATGKGLIHWQGETGAPALPLSACHPIVFRVERDWLNARIARRFEQMIDRGALDEVRAVLPHYDPALPAHRAIGVPELIGYLEGRHSLEDAKEAAVIATRQFAKRQRTWMRSKMADWHGVTPA